MGYPEAEISKDYLWLNLRELPYFRALLRAVEARNYQDLELPRPVLDIGCGDGHFATATFGSKLDVGLDPCFAPLQEAAKRGGYIQVVQADAARAPFPNGYFGSAMSNSVLEHIPHLEEVLAEIARVLKPGAPFTFSVPNHLFNPNLSISRTLDKFGLSALADAYRRFFDRIARHHHLDAPEAWMERLERAGFNLVQHWNYYSPAAMQVTEWGHYFGAPCLLYKKITGRWILVPKRWNLWLTTSGTRKYFNEPLKQEEGVCSFYITQRR